MDMMMVNFSIEHSSARNCETARNHETPSIDQTIALAQTWEGFSSRDWKFSDIRTSSDPQGQTKSDDISNLLNWRLHVAEIGFVQKTEDRFSGRGPGIRRLRFMTNRSLATR
jgi:hypothetical protein